MTTPHTYTKRHRSGATTWVKVEPGERVLIVRDGCYYRLGGQVDDVVKHENEWFYTDTGEAHPEQEALGSIEFSATLEAHMPSNYPVNHFTRRPA